MYQIINPNYMFAKKNNKTSKLNTQTKYID